MTFLPVIRKLILNILLKKTTYHIGVKLAMKCDGVRQSFSLLDTGHTYDNHITIQNLPQRGQP